MYLYTFCAESVREDTRSLTAMRAQLKKWGNSLALRVPTGLLAELNLSENSTVDLRVEDGKLIIAPMQKRKWKYSIEDLLAGVSEQNIHSETDWGSAVGEEPW
jgi:antitoxin MazE